MEQEKVEVFAERVLNEVNAAVSCLNLYLGHRLGLFKALADAGKVSSSELAKHTGYNERYLREWLECMVAGNYLDYDSGAERFSLSAEHAAVLLDSDNPAYAAPFVCWVPSLSSILAQLMEAFRTGGGVPYEAYGTDTLEAVGMGNRPMFLNDYVAKWIPALPDIESRLKSGGRVADIGCGAGWSSICLARGFPQTQIDAIDIDAASIAQARDNAEQSGVSKQITFHLGAAEKAALEGPYDLVTAFECIHDMPYPVHALKRMRELVGPKGVVFIGDEAAGNSLEENRNFLGHFFYNFSVLHCLPQALVFPGAVGTGTVLRPDTLRGYAKEAGFRQMEILPIENPFWRFYRLTP